jgi:hypothetical protein
VLLYQARIRRVESPVKQLGEMSELSTAVNGCTRGPACHTTFSARVLATWDIRSHNCSF